MPLHHALEGMNSEALVLGWRGVAIALHFLHSKVRLEAACVGGGRLCVCVYVRVSVCVCVHEYLYVCICARVSVSVLLCLSTSTRACV